MTELSLYERVLADVGAAAEPPAERPPRASAAVVPWRRGAGGRIEVFWVRRAESLRFMGGWHAFPGGGVERGDADLPCRGAPRGLEEGPEDGAMPEGLLDGLPPLGPLSPPGLPACAVRELFEETGILLASLRSPLAPEVLERARRDVVGGVATFAEALGALGGTLDASALVYAGRWLTPPLGPVRFDNRFFLLEWPRDREPQPVAHAGENVSGGWIAPADAVARWRGGEVAAAPPILHLLEVLGREGPQAGLARLRAPLEANLGPFRRVEFRPGVLVFPLRTATLPPATHTNAYLLGLGNAVLVDPGSPSPREIAWLAESLVAAEERLGRRVREIWLTHHHPDHVGGVEAMRAALRVPVKAHPAAAGRLARRGIVVDGPLEDGDRAELGGQSPFPVRVLHTPGHSRGHLCFEDETRGSLLAGDVVAGIGTIVIDPPEGDMDDYLATLTRLRDRAPRTLFPAHGPTVLDAAGKLDECLRHRLWREGRILEAWAAGHREPAAIVPRAYDDVPEIARPLAERQVVAHLERLRRAGRLG